MKSGGGKRRLSVLVGRSILALGAPGAVLLLTPVALAQAPEAAPEAAPDEAEKPEVPAQDAQLSEALLRMQKMEQRLSDQETSLAAQEARVKELQGKAEEAEARAEQAEAAAALASELGGADVHAEEDLLRLYGFADVAFAKNYVRRDSRFNGLVDRNSSFVLGSVNLYLDANPHPNIRSLTEVRFSLFPHGNLDSNLERVDSSTFDVTSATGRSRVIESSVILERAWIEWKGEDFFKVRAGYFLTPYGIWNVDHGSPTLISSVLPTFWASEYFPTRMLGVQALGEVFYKKMEFGYRAYVTNGRMTSQLDTDFFKTFGGRLYARHSGKVDLQVGTSGFWGKEADYEKTIESVEPFRVSSEKSSQYEEFGVAGDVSVDVGALRVRSEFVLNQQEYVDGLRAPGPAPGSFARDVTRWNVYGIVAYRLPWAGLEPFLYLEHADRPTAADNQADVYSAGVIAHIHPGTQFKFQSYYVHFVNDDDFPQASGDDFPGWNMRLVTAF